MLWAAVPLKRALSFPWLWSFAFALAFVSVALLAACSTSAAPSDSNDNENENESPVIVDNRSPLSRAQYKADVAFAKGYQPSCSSPPRSGRPRVLLSGFGRFLYVKDNVTGRIVSRLAGFDYPVTDPPASGQIDPPEPQTRAGVKLGVRVSDAREVDLCSVVLPVFWDLAAAILAREIEAFQPDLVVMNGVADSRQSMWIELGSMNRAKSLPDGSDLLTPWALDGGDDIPIIASGPPSAGLLMSWAPVHEAATAAIRARQRVQASRNSSAESAEDGGTDSAAAGSPSEAPPSFGDILPDAKLAGYPRGSNTYLCNNLTYVINQLMENPGQSVDLLEALDPTDLVDDRLVVSISTPPPSAARSRSLRDTPRVFLHWPSELVEHANLITPASEVLLAIVDAQLAAMDSGAHHVAPTRGSNADADPDLRGGSFF